MLEGLPGLPWLLVALAIFPALVCWWRSRALTRSIDDPALPERLIAAQQQNGWIVGPVMVILLVLAPWSALWSIPLLFAALIAGTFPLRKTLYDETWTLAGYLSFMGRFVVALWGFWIVLPLIPMISRSAEPFVLPVALTIAALLVAWNHRFGDVLQLLLRAKPIENAALAEQFTALAQRSSAGVPRFAQIDVGGGAIANAVALPSLRQSSVVFTKALLDRLDADESTAICAHELAHLEHYNPRLLRKLTLAVHALIAGGIVLAMAPRVMPIVSRSMLDLVWLGTILAFLVWRAHDRQAQETASDQRAVALCGSADALIRGLTKLHAYSRLPRRFDAEWERQSTHPSLARRLRDIRAIAGTAAAALAESSTFASTDGRTTVTFDAERVQWSEGDLATHSLGYGYLTELRLDATARGAASLVAVERGGRRWQMALAGGDVARLQAVLDVVDARLANHAAGASRIPEFVRLLLALAIVFALALGQMAIAIAGMVAVFRPASPLLAGAGVASIAAAWLSLRTTDVPGADIHIGLALALAAIGGFLVYVARKTKDEPMPRASWLALLVLTGFTAVSLVLLLSNGVDPINLHLSAVTFPSAAALLLAFATTLACWPSRLARAASVPAAVLGLLSAAAGSTLFLDRLGRDPFLGPSEPIVWRTLRGEPEHEFTLRSHASELRLSPAGNAIIVTTYSEHDDRLRFLVGRPGRDLAGIDADQLVFAGDDRVLALTFDGDDAEVREITVDAPDVVVWRERVPGITNAALSYRSDARQWRLLGWEDGGIIRATGIVGTPGTSIARWMHPAAGTEPAAQTMSASGPSVLVVQTRYATPDATQGMLTLYFSMLRGLRSESIVSRMTPEGRAEIGVSQLGLQCADVPADDDRLVCSAFDGTRTRFIAIDPASGDIAPLAVLTGRFASSSLTLNGGWLSGWSDREAVAIRPATREGVRGLEHGISHLSASERKIATLVYAGDRPTVRIYDFTPHVLRASGS